MLLLYKNSLTYGFCEQTTNVTVYLPPRAGVYNSKQDYCYLTVKIIVLGLLRTKLGLWLFIRGGEGRCPRWWFSQYSVWPDCVLTSPGPYLRCSAKSNRILGQTNNVAVTYTATFGETSRKMARFVQIQNRKNCKTIEYLTTQSYIFSDARI